MIFGKLKKYSDYYFHSLRFSIKNIIISTCNARNENVLYIEKKLNAENKEVSTLNHSSETTYSNYKCHNEYRFITSKYLP